jgi:hypothetical protein
MPNELPTRIRGLCQHVLHLLHRLVLIGKAVQLGQHLLPEGLDADLPLAKSNTAKCRCVYTVG